MILRFIPACAGNSYGNRTASQRNTVHPRVCGELPSATARPRSVSGSSPRVRGTRGDAGQAELAARFIPACAGNSSTTRTARRPTTVHPRVCGELLRLAASLAISCGSSPRVRGTRPQRRPVRPPLHGSSPRVRGTRGAPSDQPPPRRFIPACAGNSVGRRGKGGTHAVHPRVCGELCTVPITAPPSAGSSPRVRGTRRTGSRPPAGGRFIPACAGNSSPSPTCSCRTPVHPRVCGELHSHGVRVIWPWRFIPACAGNSAGTTPAGALASGSSPRVRGTRTGLRRSREVGRFIPACAGNSLGAGRQGLLVPVHPRVCGELYVVGERGPEVFGSSPRVRGTPLRIAQRVPTCRFIPACAGNSAIACWWTPSRPVHPRVCGELYELASGRSSVHGSSPRVRGTHNGVKPAILRTRFIPACAGNSSTSCRSSAPRTVHPRVCGELRPSPSMPCRFSGSSPRVRGTPTTSSLSRPWWRFIPACAGNSSPAVPRMTPPSVHPRVCGELDAHRRLLAVGRRFIPACAGNSDTGWRPRSPSSVHPRVCGELDAGAGDRVVADGSSPRVRGTPPA